MILVDGEKYACQQCIRGHRSSTCKHIQRPLVLVRSRGRPLTDSFQRIAIFAEEVQDENEKNKMLAKEKGTTKNLIAAKKCDDNSNSCCSKKTLEDTSVPRSFSEKKESCCSSKSNIKQEKYSPKTYSCCSKVAKTQPKVKVEAKVKTTCHCCPHNKPTKDCKQGPVFVLKAAKRQIFNVEKDSLKLLDPVVDVPNSKVGLDLIHKISKSKKHLCKDKMIRDEMKRMIQDRSSCCSKIKRVNPSMQKTSNSDNKPLIYQFQIPLEKSKNSLCGVTSLKDHSNMFDLNAYNSNSNRNNNINPINNKNNNSNSNTYLNNNINNISCNNIANDASLFNNNLLSDNIKANNTNLQNTNKEVPYNFTVPQTTVDKNFVSSSQGTSMVNANQQQLGSNGFLYDLYIADSCVVPGTCFCDPETCACPGCTEHGVFRDSNLTIKQQFEQFPFTPTEIDKLPDVTSNGKNDFIRPYGQVEIQSSIPLFEQAFLKSLYQGNNDLNSINDTTNNNNNDNNDNKHFSNNGTQNSSRASTPDDFEDCYCDEDSCCCFNCIKHGIVNGVCINDGRLVSDIMNMPNEIQLSGSQFPLYETSSASTHSTPDANNEINFNNNITSSNLNSSANSSNNYTNLNTPSYSHINSNMINRNAPNQQNSQLDSSYNNINFAGNETQNFANNNDEFTNIQLGGLQPLISDEDSDVKLTDKQAWINHHHDYIKNSLDSNNDNNNHSENTSSYSNSSTIPLSQQSDILSPHDYANTIIYNNNSCQTSHMKTSHSSSAMAVSRCNYNNCDSSCSCETNISS